MNQSISTAIKSTRQAEFYEQKSEEGFGFLETSGGRKCYFGENSVINKNFNHLKIGQRVSFHEEHGEKGPQVTSMSVI